MEEQELDFVHEPSVHLDEERFATQLEFIEECEVMAPSPTSIKKEQLASLLTTGKSKEFLGKDYTLTDMDKWDDKAVDKHYNRYVTVLASKTSESITSSIIKAYSSLISKFANTDKVVLEEELNNDYIITRELGRLIGFLNVVFGGPTPAMVNTAIITAKNIFSNKVDDNAN